jgi:ankyrin repeat protein
VEVKYIHGLRRYYFDAKQPPPLKATPLYYAVFCGFGELAKWLITTHAEDVNAKCYDDRTPLHVASQEGRVDAVHVLLDHGAHVNSLDWVAAGSPYISRRTREISKSCSSSSSMGVP